MYRATPRRERSRPPGTALAASRCGILVSDGRRVVRRVEAVDLTFETFGVVEADREHRTQSADVAARCTDREHSVAQRRECRLVGDREAEVIEPSPLEHRRGEALRRGIESGDLEDVAT